MTTHKHDKEFKDLMCGQMGDDIDAPICEEIMKHLEYCPDCKVHFDSVKKVVKIYKTSEPEQDVPDDVSNRLFKVLKLD